MSPRRTRSKSSSFTVIKSTPRADRAIKRNKKKKEMEAVIEDDEDSVKQSEEKPNNSLDANVSINMPTLIKFPLIKPIDEQQVNDGLDNVRVALNKDIYTYNRYLARYNTLVDDSK